MTATLNAPETLPDEYQRVLAWLKQGLLGETPPRTYNAYQLREQYAQLGIKARTLRRAITSMRKSERLVMLQLHPEFSGQRRGGFLCPAAIQDKVIALAHETFGNQDSHTQAADTISKMQERNRANWLTRRDRLEAQGIRAAQFWVTAEERAMLRGVLKQHREGKQ